VEVKPGATAASKSTSPGDAAFSFYFGGAYINDNLSQEGKNPSV